jgi:hypothetical protein
MKTIIGAALAAACVLSGAAAARADAKSCEATFDRGSQLFGAKKYDDAFKAFAAGYAACGSGHGFLSAEGFVRATQGKLEDAAALYLREASEPGPVAEAFGNLERIRDQLSAKTKARIVAMGPTKDAPVFVRGVDGEYSWARAFTCLGAKELRGVKQSLAAGKHGEMLDRLEFTCPGEKTAHVVFFDYGGD